MIMETFHVHFCNNLEFPSQRLQTDKGTCVSRQYSNGTAISAQWHNYVSRQYGNDTAILAQ